MNSPIPTPQPRGSTPSGQDDDQLVQGLYRAATGGQSWHQALERLCARLEGDFCQLIAMDKRTGRMTQSLQSSAAPIDGALDYLREYHRHDPHVAHAQTLAPGTVFHTADLISEHEAREHVFYQQFWAVYNVRYCLGGKVAEDQESAVFFGVSRSSERGAFDIQQQRELERLLTHLRQAFSIYRRVSELRARAACGQAVIERTQRPIVLLGREREVLHANPAAQAQLQRADVLLRRQRQLGCLDPMAEDRLIEALQCLLWPGEASAQGLVAGTRRAFVLSDRVGNPVPACLWGLRPGDMLGAFGDAACALLMLPTTLGAVAPDPQVLAAGFDLTPAEARFLAGLLQSPNIEQAARGLGLSFHTARSHLRRIFDKTGARDQKDLRHLARQFLVSC